MKYGNIHNDTTKSLFRVIWISDQLTSDHYALYFETKIYNPLIPFENYNQSNEKVRKNNAFSTYDSKFNFIKTQSSYSNRYQYLAVNSKHNGNVVSDRTTSQYDCIAKEAGKQI